MDLNPCFLPPSSTHRRTNWPLHVVDVIVRVLARSVKKTSVRGFKVETFSDKFSPSTKLRGLTFHKIATRRKVQAHFMI